MRVARSNKPLDGPPRWNGRQRGGAAALEVAITLPLILALMLGIWEFGRLTEAQQIISNAAREGGRQASTGSKTVAQVQSDVLNYLKLAGLLQTQGSTAGQALTGVTVTVTNLSGGPADPTQANQLDHFRVSLSVPADQLRWVVLSPGSYSNYLPAKITTLTASADWYSMKDIPVTVPETIPPQ